MKICLAFVGTLAKSARPLALAAISLGATSAMAANYWKGVDGADLATPANWSEEALPTAAGYFNGQSEHGADYTVTLSADTSFYQFIWGGNEPVAGSAVLDLGEKVLTLTASSARPIRLEADKVSSVTITNGTLTFATATESAWVLGSNQTLTFGAGLAFNGNAALNGASARSGNRIVVGNGAKVNGIVSVGAYQTDAEILVTGESTAVDYGSGQFTLPTAATSSDSAFRVADKASVNSGSGQNAQVGQNGATRMTLSVESGATFQTGDYSTSAGKWLYLGKSGVAGGNRIFVGDGATLGTRVFVGEGTDNSVVISNGTFSVGAYAQFGTGASDAITLSFAGTSPHLDVASTTHGHALFEGTPTLAFDIPAEGYSTVPITRGNSIAIPDTAQLVVNAREYMRAGGGKLTLMSVTGSNKTLTASETLLARWNAELGSTANVSVVDGNKLVLTVKQPGLTIIFK